MQFGSEIDKADGAAIPIPVVDPLSKENSKDIGIMTIDTSRVMDKDRF
jgi:hypothetical protein